jgi:ABC-type lipoprotein release transport system permease subunit
LPRTAQIGLRDVGRRRRRSMSTALVIAFAVGTLLAVLGLAAGATSASRASWGDHGEDVKVNIDVPFTFPLWNLMLVLAGTVLLALLITLAPIRRAVHNRPGDALRYA